ncbi:hypothetical protein ISN45_Aa07g035000 [Arabidopsis thaliana x Arabidopsis arenosa]|uniref:Uncharacterized protein n=1 Tax=Arabidopsis thaliana x Arabidopsis arenosa TaxID=1240361 RepID=A0A8T1Y9B2_9BRAS|nr:hypothetical protein ISN45_Aa07g035000 [Arabidopsis thaliana x Arabidopsis arenosa]
MDQRFEKRMINVLLAHHLDKNKVVWIQSGNDFVDLLYSFLTMPLGTIVRLLENHGILREKVREEFASRLGGCNDYDGVFVHGDGNFAFVLSDDLIIENFSWDLFLKPVKDLGCVNVLDELVEGEAEIGFRFAK